MRVQDPSGVPQPPRWSVSATSILRWLVAVLALVGAVLLLWRHGSSLLDLLRGLIQARRDLWNGLWGGFAVGPRSATGFRAAPAARPRPFSAYPDPFRTGLAGHSPPEDLIRYTFEALEAWAAERDLGRRPQETPLEFVDRVGLSASEIADATRRLAALYGEVAYGTRLSDRAVRPTLERVWDGLSAPSVSVAVP
jgi:hypothetical protein